MTAHAISCGMLAIIAAQPSPWVEVILGFILIAFFAVMIIGALTGFK